MVPIVQTFNYKGIEQCLIQENILISSFYSNQFNSVTMQDKSPNQYRLFTVINSILSPCKTKVQIST
jgi:hypothetical protein